MSQETTTLTCDVLIVGGGPAGSCTAMSFLQHNPHLKVIIADKVEFPRDKACGDALSPGAIACLEDLGIDTTELPEQHQLKEVGLHGGKTLYMTGSLQSTDRKADYAITMPRYILDSHLVNEAERRGASILTSAKFVDYVPHGRKLKVLLKHPVSEIFTEVVCKMMVGADGANSRVRGKMGIKSASLAKTGIAIRAYVDIQDEMSERGLISFIDALRPGYGWVFPMARGQANIGCSLWGPDRVSKKVDLRSLFESYLLFLESKGVMCDNVRDRKTYALPSGLEHGLTNGKVALVGDAGNLINPITGEGIYYGILSGMRLADNTHEAIAMSDGVEDALRNYEKEMQRRLGKYFKTCHKGTNMLRGKRLSRIMLGAASVDQKVRVGALDWMFYERPVSFGFVVRMFVRGFKFLFKKS